MTASPPRPVPPLVRALLDVREILEHARRTGDRREIETAIERINAAEGEMALLRGRVWTGPDQNDHEAEPAQVEPITGTGIGEAATDAGLAQEWPRESDASAKEAQVGGPGRVTPRKVRWRS